MHLILAGSLCLGFFVAAADEGPPGAIVIRPGGTGASAGKPEEIYPDKPGFIVIRPQRSGSVTKSIAEATATPVIRIIRGPDGKPLLPEAPPPPPGTTPPAEKTDPKTPVDEKDGKIILETWDACYLKGQKVGHFHVLVREFERDGKKFHYATKYQKMTVSRFGQVVDQWGEDTTMETTEGEILVTRMRQGIGQNQMLSLTGQVKGRVLNVTIEGAAGGNQEVPWPDGVISITREATLLKDRKPKPGDSFEYLSYEGRLNRVVKFTANVKAIVDAPLSEGQQSRKLLQVELSMEPIGNFRLPTSTLWADATTFEPLKMESDMPTLGGKMTVLRTTKAAATRPPSKVIELFDVQSIRLDREVPNVHEKSGLVYRIKLNSDLAPNKVLVQDDRQTIQNVDEATKTFELQVNAVREPGKVENPLEGGPEFLSSSFFVDWDNEQVRAHARKAAAGLPVNASNWQKARAVEAWVNRNMRATEFSQAMATCSNVAKTLSGDCTEYAMLAAGMCRALGVPSRTALGLVYAPSRDGKPFMAYHMWFEVLADGRWLALDATLGRGSIGPGHVKITDASWHEERSFAPLLPVLTVLGASPRFEVVRVTDGRR